MPLSDTDSSEDGGGQVRISLKLAPSVKDRSFEVSTEPIAVPADIGQKGLTAAVNHLLGRSVSTEDGDENGSVISSEDDNKMSPINFEFVVGRSNKLLRKGIENEARQNGLSLEQEISVTYFPAIDVPHLSDKEEELPDWISCMSFGREILCTGCYDGSLHIYRRSKGLLNEITKTTVASGPIKCVASTSIGSDIVIASASMDQSLNIHQYSKDSLAHGGNCVNGHQSSAVSSLAFSEKLASGDGNGTICIWNVLSAEEPVSEASETRKKLKALKGHVTLRTYHPHGSLPNAHGQTVSGLSWGNASSNTNSHLISGSWDHSIKLWDIEKQDCLVTLNGSRIVACLDTSYHSEGVVATGHPDCTIRLWDVRANSEKHSALIADNTFRPSHKALVSSVQWSRSNAYHLASTSHDGTVKLWDTRSSTPLYSIRTFPKEEKGLCLAWETASEAGDCCGSAIYVGGTDRKIKTVSFKK
jgi:ribosome biogenesis protein